MNKLRNPIFVVRTDLSSYHRSDFRQLECARLNAIEGVVYSDECEDTLSGKQLTEQDLQDLPRILLTNTHTRFDRLTRDVLDACVLVLHANSGYDNLPVDLVARPDLEIVVGNPIRAGAVATYVLTQLFNHYNPSPHNREWQSGRHWVRRSMDSLRVLLLGYGHIGKIVHAALNPVVGEILVQDPFLGMEVENLAEKVDDIDVVIPLMSLNPTSRQFLGADLFARLPQDFVLINGARGDLIDQSCLIATLKDRPRAFAYLDVFREEPFNCDEFAGLENIRLSSHVAGVFSGIDSKIIDFEEQVIRDFISLTKSAFRQRYETLLLRNRIFNDFLI